MKLTKDCVLVVVDVQEAFRNVIKEFDEIAAQISIAVQGFQTLGLPIIITEQYPKGLRETCGEILSVADENVQVIEKITFSSYNEPKFVEALTKLNVKQVVVCGLETHICVNQTVDDLLANNYEVHLLKDCVTSRFHYNKQIGLSKMTASGAINSSVEMALFEIMIDAKHAKFKEIQKLIK
jgi:nicotinamidase-related amidase